MIYVFRSDEQPVLLAASDAEIQIMAVHSDAEWAKVLADARLGRMVENMPPLSTLHRLHTVWRFSYWQRALDGTQDLVSRYGENASRALDGEGGSDATD